MERKSRYKGYNDKFLTARWYRWSTYLYVFCAWNGLSILIYKLIKDRKVPKGSKEEEAWNRMTGTQKYLYFLHYGKDEQEKKIRHIKIKGFSTYTVNDRTVKDIIGETVSPEINEPQQDEEFMKE